MEATRNLICLSAILLSAAIGVVGQGPAQPSAPSPSSAPSQAAPASTPQAASNPTNTASSVSDNDKQFLKDVAEGNMAEVQLGQLAAQKAVSDAVKQFGQRMVNDHGKASEEIKQIAATNNVALPQQLSAADQATKDRLAALSGSAFDQLYLDIMVKNHDDDIAAFRRERQIGTNAKVKDFAQTTLPTLEEHLKALAGIMTNPASPQPAAQPATSPTP